MITSCRFLKISILQCHGKSVRHRHSLSATEWYNRQCEDISNGSWVHQNITKDEEEHHMKFINYIYTWNLARLHKKCLLLGTIHHGGGGLGEDVVCLWLIVRSKKYYVLCNTVCVCGIYMCKGQHTWTRYTYNSGVALTHAVCTLRCSECQMQFILFYFYWDM